MVAGMDAPVSTAAPADAGANWAQALIEARQTILPKRLAAPGPRGDELHRILAAAGHAPDHDRLLPWRFILVSDSARERLADAFAQSLLERDASASAEQVQQARDKAHRAPVLMLAVARLEGDAQVPDAERILSAGCAIQNLMLMATALGYGSALTSGKALHSPGFRGLFGLGDNERALCFVSIGTPTARKPRRERPPPEAYVTELKGSP